MIFNSLTFVIFFLVTYTIYLLCFKNHKFQNFLLLAASFVFYGYSNVWLLLLFMFSIISNYSFANFIQKSDKQDERKNILYIAVVFNLSILGFFKYFNFFALNIKESLSFLGLHIDWISLNIILPVGISFYTFQLMSYVIDVYKGDLKHNSNLFDFALFISFFPQLVAGPIERATDLLPQVLSPRKLKIDQINVGIYLIIWGFFKKLVVADNLANISKQIFDNYTQYQGLDILIGVLSFTFQIYCDFSAYSDIARGVAKLMGFELIVNFKLPYFALNPSDFWSRWHISLSQWLRDYLYIPLGGNRRGDFNTYRNLFLTMLLGGLWHGAAWNFVIWGAYQGLILMIYRLYDKRPEHLDPWSGKYPYWLILSKMFLMFILTNIGWVIFRSSSVGQIYYILTNVGLKVSDQSLTSGYTLIFFCLPLLIVQLCQYVSRDLLILTKLNPFIRVPIYSFLIIWICIFGVRESGEFIYFQF
jgi:alginate O-acetyltransferase complex protein AlgI